MTATPEFEIVRIREVGHSDRVSKPKCRGRRPECARASGGQRSHARPDFALVEAMVLNPSCQKFPAASPTSRFPVAVLVASSGGHHEGDRRLPAREPAIYWRAPNSNSLSQATAGDVSNEVTLKLLLLL